VLHERYLTIVKLSFWGADCGPTALVALITRE
jgi:hypothetical protein